MCGIPADGGVDSRAGLGIHHTHHRHHRTTTHRLDTQETRGQARRGGVRGAGGVDKGGVRGLACVVSDLCVLVEWLCLVASCLVGHGCGLASPVLLHD